MLNKNRSEDLNNLRNLSKLIEDMWKNNATGYEYILEPGTNDYYIKIKYPSGLLRGMSLISCISFSKMPNKEWEINKPSKDKGRIRFIFPLPENKLYQPYSYILAVAVGILIPDKHINRYPNLPLKELKDKSKEWHNLVRAGHVVHINHLDGDCRDSHIHNLEVTTGDYNMDHGIIIRALHREYKGKYTSIYYTNEEKIKLRGDLYLTTEDIKNLEKWIEEYNKNVRIQRSKNKGNSKLKIIRIKSKEALDWLISYKGYDSLLGPNKLAL